MADKVGANKIFVRTILVGFLLAILLVGALLSIFYHGALSIYILLALVVLPAIGLVVMFVIRISPLFCKDKDESMIFDESRQDILSISDDDKKSIILSGSELGVPLYQQLMFEPFAGEPEGKTAKRTMRPGTRPKTVTRSAYADYVDTYNGVKQGQMCLEGWQEVSRGDPIEVSFGERQAILAGDLSSAEVELYRDAIEQSAEEPCQAPSRRRRSERSAQRAKTKGRETGARGSRGKKQYAVNTVVEPLGASDEAVSIGFCEGNKSRENLTFVRVDAAVAPRARLAPRKSAAPKAPAQPRKIIFHKKPAVDKRDDYVYVPQPKVDTDRPIKLMLSERFSDLNLLDIHSASQELLAKMRREKTRR